jgi:hypothetical protein
MAADGPSNTKPLSTQKQQNFVEQLNLVDIQEKLGQIRK